MGLNTMENTKLSFGDFNVEVANEVGVEVAILSEALKIWTSENLKGKESYTWNRDNFDEFMSNFPFWNEEKIREMMRVLKNKGYVETKIYFKFPKRS